MVYEKLKGLVHILCQRCSNVLYANDYISKVKQFTLSVESIFRG